MPFLENRWYRLPVPAEDALLWRYMDLSRFLSMLSTGSLYFCRADLFEDQWEGAYPESHFKKFKPHERPAIKSLPKLGRRKAYVNCWHLNPNESAAMWKLYSQSNESIAIQTTSSALKKSCLHAPHHMFLGKITYCDHSKTHKFWGNDTNPIRPFFAKKKCFAHERELRALIWSQKLEDRDGGKYEVRDPKKLPSGIAVPVDLKTLIQRIYVSPKSEDWFASVVKDVVQKYGFSEDDVLQSQLYKPPDD